MLNIIRYSLIQFRIQIHEKLFVSIFKSIQVSQYKLLKTLCNNGTEMEKLK